MKQLFGVAFLLLTSVAIYAQEQINANMPFQSDDSKDYSIVIPSTYVEGESIAAFLALHPLNTSRWNGETWCEELADFAEANNVILVCPDGGLDGKIDDAIDTAFTSFLLDSAFIWYDIDPNRLYATGFSWGAKTTYTYGLNHIEKFAGLMPIGAAISVSEVNNIKENADGVSIYIVHGSQDSPNSRFYPLRDAMLDNGACVESNLLSGVGHTIDFANQLEILTEAYNYLKENACTVTSTKNSTERTKTILKYNTLESGQQVELLIDDVKYGWSIFTTTGVKVASGKGKTMVVEQTSGHYIIKVGEQSEIFRVL